MNDISIIIPCFNGQKYLDNCLEIISKNIPQAEIIVVDDGSEKPLSINKLPVNLIRLDKNQGAGAARNEGAKRASNEFLVFVDSDVIFKKMDLLALINPLKERENIVTQGTYIPSNFKSDWFNRFWADFQYWKAIWVGDSPYQRLSTFFFAIKKEDFLKVGGFHNQFKPGQFFEDQEFGRHLLKSGFSIELCMQAECIHLHQFNLKSFFNYQINVPAGGFFYLLQKKFLFEEKKDKNFQATLLPQKILVVLAFLIIPLIALEMCFFAFNKKFMGLSTYLYILANIFWTIPVSSLRYKKINDSRGFFIYPIIGQIVPLSVLLGLLKGGLNFLFFFKKHVSLERKV